MSFNVATAIQVYMLTGSSSEDVVESTHKVAQIWRGHESTKEVGTVDYVSQQDGLEVGR